MSILIHLFLNERPIVAQGGPIVSHLFLNEINGRQLVDPGQQSSILEKTESLSYFLPFNNIQSANLSFQ